MNFKRHHVFLFLTTLFLASWVVAEQKPAWWKKMIPGQSTPMVLSDTPSKPLVNPDPVVLNLQNAFAEVAKAVKPAVVNISAIHIQKAEADDPNQFFFGDPNEFFYRFFGEEPPPQQQRRAPKQREYRSEGTGSGVIIDPDGYVLTNNHVVQGADQLTITLSDGKSLKGQVVGTDSRTDLAIVRIKSADKFNYVPLGDSSAIRIGDWVLAIGSPFGLEQTVTAGIISAIRQSLNIEGRTFSNLIQTDAAINRGNSGGPLVNIQGQLVGINTAIYAPTGVFSGIGFAIPVNDAKKILQDLIQKGYVERSWLGVEIAEMDDVMAQQFGLEKAQGALINGVVPDSPAAKGGLMRGDVIVEVDGKKAKNVGEVQDMVSRTHPNTSVNIKVIRNGQPRILKIKTELMPKQEENGEQKPQSKPGKEKEPDSTVKWLGAEFAGLTPLMKDKYGVDRSVTSGVVVVDVPASSLASEAGLEEGDVIRAINRMKVEGRSDLKEVSKKVDPKKGLVLDVVRQGKSFYLSYKSLQ